jgi:hypothetical protein
MQREWREKAGENFFMAKRVSGQIDDPRFLIPLRLCGSA